MIECPECGRKWLAGSADHIRQHHNIIEKGRCMECKPSKNLKAKMYSEDQVKRMLRYLLKHYSEPYLSSRRASSIIHYVMSKY